MVAELGYSLAVRKVKSIMVGNCLNTEDILEFTVLSEMAP